MRLPRSAVNILRDASDAVDQRGGRILHAKRLRRWAAHVGLDPAGVDWVDDDVRVLEVQLAREVVEGGLAGAVGGAWDWELIHVGDGGDARGDGNELRGAGGFLEEGEHGLEEDQGPDGVDFEVHLCFPSGRRHAGAPVVGDAGVGDHDIEVRDGVFGEGGDGGGGVGG